MGASQCDKSLKTNTSRMMLQNAYTIQEWGAMPNFQYCHRRQKMDLPMSLKQNSRWPFRSSLTTLPLWNNCQEMWESRWKCISFQQVFMWLPLNFKFNITIKYIWFQAFTVTKFNEFFSGYQQHQVSVWNWHFKYHLSPHHQGSVSYRHLTQLIAQEDFIE